MEGWKTWAGAVGLIAAGLMDAFGMKEVSTSIYELAIPMVVIGIGHKFDKIAKVLRTAGSTAVSMADQMDKAAPAPTSVTTPQA